MFSLLYLVYLKHARIVDAFTCLQTVWVILKYACSCNQVNIYACVSYKGGCLQLYGSFLFIVFLNKLVKWIYRMFTIWYKKIKIKVNHIVAGVYIYLVTTAGVFKYDRMWRMIDMKHILNIYISGSKLSIFYIDFHLNQ